MAGKLKLVYFDIRGRAEMIRLMLAAAGQSYEEERIQFDEWPAFKAKTPFGTLPYIVHKGRTFGQSTAIAQYVAREFGFYGKTNQDACRIAEVTGLWEDQLTSAIVKYRFAKDEAAKEEFKKKILEEDLPRFFGYYEKFLEENGSTGYIVGKALTLADFYIYDMEDSLIELKEDALKPYPLMTKLRKNVETHAKVKVYLANRKKTPF